MRNKNKSAAARNSGALDPKPMRLVDTKGFDAHDDKRVGADAQEEIRVRPADGQGYAQSEGGLNGFRRSVTCTSSHAPRGIRH